ncbi:MAG: hypothetical protein H8E48_00345, partial [Chloroflexi bacterium]|nr:hypothetical protein [Chloroflexota bacterium]
MTQQATTQQTLLAEFALLFQPLVTAAAQPQPGGLLFLFHQDGVDLDSLVIDTTRIADGADGISDSFQVLHELFESGDMPDLNEVGTLTDSVIEVTGLVRGLGQSFPLRSDVATTAEEIGQALLDYLIITHLQRNHRGLFSMLMLTGVVVVEKTDDEGVGRLKLHPGKISDLITDPMGAFAETYNLAAGSDTEDFDDSAIMLLILLQGLFRSLGIPAGIRNTPSDIVSAAGLDPETTSSAQQQLRVPIVTIVEDGTAAQAGLSIVPVPPTSSEDGGLAVVPFGTGAASKTISLGEQLSLEIVISGEAPSSYGLIARPESVSFANLGEGATPANLYVRLTLVNEAQDGSTLILGSEDGPRLEVGSFGIQMGFDYADGEAEFFVALPVKGGRITLGSPDGDGFLSKILPEDGASADFDLTVGWSSLNGFYFEGSSSLSVSLPTQISIGPLAIDAVHLEIGPSDDGAIALAAGATVAVTLGPVTLTVENLGLEAQLSFPENGDGNMGPLDLQIGVRPPDGAGISVDAGLVEGGGYLFFDRDKGEYAGSFELTIGEISVKAIGILTTKMPGGADGYSLMIIISGEFPSLQLGYGFTLNGVGGLAGINRSVEVEVL